ncbi:hypothetical protein ACFTSF_03780 [Kribbella sp. NPDC056951]|uniref:hypothetical protein n=1 Tax=Kribbella sp. NPDC056951 TaxID=3345978 RepID=UPI0036402A5E
MSPSGCLFIGDQITGIEAGQAAGVATVDYANKPGKVEALQNDGTDVIVTTMLTLARALG